MNVGIITVGPFEVNCAVVWNEAGQALVIDPGYDAPMVQSCLDAHGLTVAAYLLTHGHADHINALAELHAIRPAPVYLHAADQTWAFAAANQIPPYYPIPEKPNCEILDPTNPPQPSTFAKAAADKAGAPPQEGNSPAPLHGRGGRNDLSAEAQAKAEVTAGEGRVICIGDLTFRTIETPGHTLGCVCYWFESEGVCFTGDTLFKGSCGRTDLPGGSGRVLAQSLKKLAALPPKTRIIAGHGDETTIACELKTNFFLQ
jgi:hydroxyacylglutathione hydrolase